jgi:ubiquitin-conjugating enzyme E2 J1
MSLKTPGGNTPAIKRITREYQDLIKQPSPYFIAAPLKLNLFEWHFTLRGPRDSEFQGGKYHGKLLLPSDYPFSPPDFIFLTPNGRYDIGTKICLSITRWHVEEWQPTWSIRKMIEAVAVFMVTPPEGAVGALDYPEAARKVLAEKSGEWKCPECKVTNEMLLPGEEDPEQIRLDAVRNDGEKKGKGDDRNSSGNNNITNAQSIDKVDNNASSNSSISANTNNNSLNIPLDVQNLEETNSITIFPTFQHEISSFSNEFFPGLSTPSRSAINAIERDDVDPLVGGQMDKLGDSWKGKELDEFEKMVQENVEQKLKVKSQENPQKMMVTTPSDDIIPISLVFDDEKHAVDDGDDGDDGINLVKNFLNSYRDYDKLFDKKTIKNDEFFDGIDLETAKAALLRQKNQVFYEFAQYPLINTVSTLHVDTVLDQNDQFEFFLQNEQNEQNEQNDTKSDNKRSKNTHNNSIISVSMNHIDLEYPELKNKAFKMIKKKCKQNDSTDMNKITNLSMRCVDTGNMIEMKVDENIKDNLVNLIQINNHVQNFENKKNVKKFIFFGHLLNDKNVQKLKKFDKLNKFAKLGGFQFPKIHFDRNNTQCPSLSTNMPLSNQYNAYQSYIVKDIANNSINIVKDMIINDYDDFFSKQIWNPFLIEKNLIYNFQILHFFLKNGQNGKNNNTINSFFNFFSDNAALISAQTGITHISHKNFISWLNIFIFRLHDEHFPLVKNFVRFDPKNQKIEQNNHQNNPPHSSSSSSPLTSTPHPLKTPPDTLNSPPLSSCSPNDHSNRYKIDFLKFFRLERFFAVQNDLKNCLKSSSYLTYFTRYIKLLRTVKLWGDLFMEYLQYGEGHRGQGGIEGEYRNNFGHNLDQNENVGRKNKKSGEKMSESLDENLVGKNNNSQDVQYIEIQIDMSNVNGNAEGSLEDNIRAQMVNNDRISIYKDFNNGLNGNKAPQDDENNTFDEKSENFVGNYGDKEREEFLKRLKSLPPLSINDVKFILLSYQSAQMTHPYCEFHTLSRSKQKTKIDQRKDKSGFGFAKLFDFY